MPVANRSMLVVLTFQSGVRSQPARRKALPRFWPGTWSSRRPRFWSWGRPPPVMTVWVGVGLPAGGVGVGGVGQETLVVVVLAGRAHSRSVKSIHSLERYSTEATTWPRPPAKG